MMMLRCFLQVVLIGVVGFFPGAVLAVTVSDAKFTPSTITAGDSSRLSWQSTNAQYCTVDGVNNGTANYINYQNLTASKTVRIICVNGRARASATANVTVNPKPPLMPAFLTPTPTTTANTSVALSWGKSNGTTQYQLERRQGTGAWDNIYTGSVNSATSSNMSVGSWTFRVKACHATGCSGYRTSAVVTIQVPVPGIPVSLSVSPASTSELTVAASWAAASGTVSRYEAQRQLGSGAWETFYSGANLSANSTNMRLGTWQFRVRACNTTGCSDHRIGNPVIIIEPIPKKPSISVPSSSTTGNINVSWSSSGAITAYHLQRKQASQAWKLIYQGLNTTQAEELTHATYHYRVKACNNQECSPWSDTVTTRISSVVYPDYAQPFSGTMADTTWVEPTVPENENVGALAGDGGVSGGSATYSIPIALPPGRAGMQPNVSLNYSSRHSNGVVGVGWQLSAGSFISRCARTIAQDGSNSPPQYDAANDRLCLDGQRLMNVQGAYGASGTIYRTELDNFSRVTQTGGINDVNSSFAIETKDGLIKNYGTTPDSIQTDDGRIEPRRWALSQVRDRANNAMRYVYVNQGNGEYTLDKIHYTDTVDVGQGNRMVSFEYETRSGVLGKSDYLIAYLAGGKSQVTQRLKSIKTWLGNTIIRDYRLAYAHMSLATGRTLLRSVEECAYQAGIESCLPKTTFEWQEKAFDYHLEPITFKQANGVETQPFDGDQFAYIDQIAPYKDTNRDGSIDWPQTYLYEQGFPLDKGYYTNAEGVQTGTHTTPRGECKAGRGYQHTTTGYHSMAQCQSEDFNQDGLADTWRYHNGGIDIGYTNANQSITWQTTLIKKTDAKLSSLSFVHSIKDVNGDGWPDFMVLRRTYGANPTHPAAENKQFLDVYLHTQDVNAPYASAQTLFEYEMNVFSASMVSFYAANVNTQPRLLDMNNDGILDVIKMRVNDYGLKFGGYATPTVESAWMTEVEANGSLSLTSKSLRFYPFVTTEYYSQFLDVNGDGLLDWLAWSGYRFALKINQGNFKFSSKIDLGIAADWPALVYNGGSDNPPLPDDNTRPEIERHFMPKMMQALRVLDVNGDGRDELLLPGERIVEACVRMPVYSQKPQPQYENICGDDFYQPWRVGFANEKPLDPRYDRSIHAFNALYFDIDASGQVTTRLKDSGIVSAIYENSIIDAFGDGLQDVIFMYNDEPSGQGEFGVKLGIATGKMAQFNDQHGAYIMRNRGVASSSQRYAHPDLLKQVKTGLGVTSQWQYRPLSSGLSVNGIPFYETDDVYVFGTAGKPDDYLHFASSLSVVSEFTQSNGLGHDTNTTRYAYRGAVYHTKGLGFQGFRSIIKDSPNGVRAVTDFHQKFPLSGEIEEIRSCLIRDTDNDCKTQPLSETRYGYKTVNTAGAQVKWNIPVKKVQIQRELNGRGVLSTSTQFVGLIDPGSDWNNLIPSIGSYDNYGNIKHSTQQVDAGFGVSETQTQMTFAPVDEVQWWLNQLKSSQVTTKKLQMLTKLWSTYDATLDSDKVVTTTIEGYHVSRRPLKVTVSPSEGKKLVTKTVYNASGLPMSVTTSSPDELGSQARKVATTYSTDGYFVKTVTDDVGTVTTEFDAALGMVSRVTDLNGLVSTWHYDAFGRLTKTTEPGVPNTYVRYALCDNCDQVSHADVVYKITKTAAGSPETVEYRDKLNRVLVRKTQVFNGGNAYVSVKYDALGRKTFESVPSATSSGLLGTTYSDYDVLGRLLEKTLSQTMGQSLTVNYTYGANLSLPHQTKVIVNQGSQVMYRTYNGLGQLMQTTDAMGTPGVTQYAYDGAGNPIVLKDANGISVTATYNGLGQKKWVKDPNMGQKSFTYTGFGEVLNETDEIGNVLAYQYDKVGRLTLRTATTTSGVEQNHFVFDNPNNQTDKCLGLPSNESVGNGTGFSKSYHYNNLCQLVSTETTVDGETLSVKQLYDGGYGRLKALVFPNGVAVGYEYTGEGYLKRVFNPESNYTFRNILGGDEQGRWTQANLINNTATIIRDYDLATGQLKESEWFNATQSLQKLSYQYDVYGNLQTQSVQNQQSQVSTETYAYDNLHRLTQTSRQIAGLTETLNTHFGFDAVGNILKKTDFSADSANAFTYGDIVRNTANSWAGPNAVHKVILADGATRTYAYDKNGNLTSDGLRKLSYNAFNKPTQITMVAGTINPKLDNAATSASTLNLFYGADQIRYKQEKSVNGKTTTHWYVGQLYEQVSTKNNGVLVSTEKKAYIDDIAVVTETIHANQTTEHQVSYFHRDRLGSMTAEIDHLSQITRTHSFDAFGRPRNENTSDKVGLQQLLGSSTNRGFTNHEHLDEVQLIHMNGRVYDYNLGRFLSVDPFIQEPGDSQSMNPYSYIMNNPLAGTDPSGYVSAWDRVRCGANVYSDKCEGEDDVQKSLLSGASVSNGKSAISSEPAKPELSPEELEAVENLSLPTTMEETGSTNGESLDVRASRASRASALSRELKQCAAVSAGSSCLSNKKVKSLSSNPAGTDRPDKANPNYVDNITVDKDGNVEINLDIAYSGNGRRAKKAAKNIRKAYGKAGVTINFTVIEDASKADLIIRGASLKDFVSSGLVCDCATAQFIGGWAPSDSNVNYPRSLLVGNVNNGNHYLIDAHEFGHKLGLSHRNDFGILAYPPKRGRDRRKVTESDVNRIRSLYGQ